MEHCQEGTGSPRPELREAAATQRKNQVPRSVTMANREDMADAG